MCPITSASHTSVMLKEKKEKQKKHCRLNLKTHRRHFPYDSCRRCLRIAVVYSATCSVSVFTSVSCICRASPVGRWSSSSLAHVFFVRKFPATESDTLFFVKSRKYVPGGLADEGRSLGGGVHLPGPTYSICYGRTSHGSHPRNHARCFRHPGLLFASVTVTPQCEGNLDDAGRRVVVPSGRTPNVAGKTRKAPFKHSTSTVYHCFNDRV